MRFFASAAGEYIYTFDEKARRLSSYESVNNVREAIFSLRGERFAVIRSGCGVQEPQYENISIRVVETTRVVDVMTKRETDLSQL